MKEISLPDELIEFERFAEIIKSAKIGSSETKYLKEPLNKPTKKKDEVINYEFLQVEFDKFGISSTKMERLRALFNKFFSKYDGKGNWADVRCNMIQYTNGILSE